MGGVFVSARQPYKQGIPFTGRLSDFCGSHYLCTGNTGDLGGRVPAAIIDDDHGYESGDHRKRREGLGDTVGFVMGGDYGDG